MKKLIATSLFLMLTACASNEQSQHQKEDQQETETVAKIVEVTEEDIHEGKFATHYTEIRAFLHSLMVNSEEAKDLASNKSFSLIISNDSFSSESSPVVFQGDGDELTVISFASNVSPEKVMHSIISAEDFEEEVNSYQIESIEISNESLTIVTDQNAFEFNVAGDHFIDSEDVRYQMIPGTMEEVLAEKDLIIYP